MSDEKNQITETDEVQVDDLQEEAGAGTLSSAGTASCPATFGTAACW
ncbi:hypothetical protein BN12_400005 [Nostocoides japonicum T1-X7]|uniref:Uncharacterized protein n=1 Tax=Nostocoides japonicum T1-X7 TaxID=1194083 RepID=A0A077LZS3_9MICO|nr:thiocillin family RiPP [Tetrasphaera japonica]CCH79096.1 hypothetical protein BN12_400005 [Tetrasphaera japonica T1-X7]